MRATSTHRRVAVAVAVAVALGLLTACRAGGQDPKLTAAEKVVADGSRFGNGPAAREAFATVAQDLLESARACDAKHHGRSRPPGCEARYSGAGLAEVVSTAVRDCTQPGIVEARNAMRTYLDQLPSITDATTKAPPVPAVPSC